MKYYLDTEFHEYQRKSWFSKPFRTIELISIGIVAEDGREYYAISKDFDLKAAWGSWQPKDHNLNMGIVKEYWLRDNVLKTLGDDIMSFSRFKTFINHIGKSNAQIAEEIHDFIYKEYLEGTGLSYSERIKYSNPKYDPEFYAYYADYDWVVFCWLFGKMIDLPKGFPMYCRDLKQMFDEIKFECSNNIELWGKDIKKHPDYPKQSNEHNALADAKWNKELHEFIEKL